MKFFIRFQIKEVTFTKNKVMGENIYLISYEEFDDLKNSVWRNMADKGDYDGAIRYMKNYLKVNLNNLENYQIGAIYWHIGQLYALNDNYDMAIKFMSQTEVSSSIDDNYKLGTICFLKKKLSCLKRCYNNLKINDPSVSKDILKNFILNFDKSYKEVY